MTLGTGYWGEACLQQHHGLAAEHEEGGQHLRRKVRCLIIFFLKNGASTARTLLLLWVLTLHVQQWTAMSVAAACSGVGYLLNELKRTEKEFVLVGVRTRARRGVYVPAATGLRTVSKRAT